MAAVVGDVYLRQALDAPEQAVRPRRRGRIRLTDGTLRLSCAGLDAMQMTVLGAAALTFGFAAAGSALGIAQAICLGAVAAAIAGSARRAFRRSVAGRETAGARAVRAAGGVLVAVLVVAICTAVLVPSPAPLLSGLVVWAAGSTALSGGLRLTAGRLSRRQGRAAIKVAIVGETDRVRAVAGALEGGRWPGWHLTQQLQCDTPSQLDQLRALVVAGGANIVVLAVPAGDASRIGAVWEVLSDAPVRLCLALESPVLDRAAPANALKLVDLAPDPHAGADGTLKRALDVMLGGLALAVLAPALGLAALAIRLESPGPALFHQWRFGAGSQPIQVLKLRTMRVDKGDATGERRTLARDPRVTRIGRFLRRSSIDELPQLINVLRGEMSLVGPRPHPIFMKVDGAFYFEVVERYRARHRVRPGITGWAQINGSRGEVDTLGKAQRRVALDLWYIEHWSLALDLRIILRTLLGGFITFRAD